MLLYFPVSCILQMSYRSVKGAKILEEIDHAKILVSDPADYECHYFSSDNIF